jgi:phosphatidylglycerophosphatase A
MLKINSVPRSIWRDPVQFIAFGFGSGASPYMPGTVGTLAAVPFYLLLQPLSINTYLLTLMVLTLISFWLCHRAGKAVGETDHSGIVLDEFIGYFITMTAAPAGGVWLLLGFILFRFFDIYKPWPIHYIDNHMPGGIGVVLDDVVAGVFAGVLLYALTWVV